MTKNLVVTRSQKMMRHLAMRNLKKKLRSSLKRSRGTKMRLSAYSRLSWTSTTILGSLVETVTQKCPTPLSVQRSTTGPSITGQLPPLKMVVKIEASYPDITHFDYPLIKY